MNTDQSKSSIASGFHSRADEFASPRKARSPSARGIAPDGKCASIISAGDFRFFGDQFFAPCFTKSSSVAAVRQLERLERGRQVIAVREHLLAVGAAQGSGQRDRRSAARASDGRVSLSAAALRFRQIGMRPPASAALNSPVTGRNGVDKLLGRHPLDDRPAKHESAFRRQQRRRPNAIDRPGKCKSLASVRFKIEIDARDQIRGQPFEQIGIPCRLIHVVDRFDQSPAEHWAQRRLTIVRDSRPSSGLVMALANCASRCRARAFGSIAPSSG